jgi:hypothetical protein
MQEYWFCESCKSMNKANARTCYRCRAPRETAAMATVTERARGTVLTPGLDENDRQIAWALMARHRYTSIWPLGYLTALLMGVVAVFEASVIILYVWWSASLDLELPAPNGDPTWGAILNVLIIMGVVSIPVIVLHSIFLGLTALNSPALGSGNPAFDPVRCGLWWLENVFWLFLAYVVCLLPTRIALRMFPLLGIVLGLMVGFIWFVVVLWLSGMGIRWLLRPRLPIIDLYERLSVPGAPSSRMTMWWSAARGLVYGVPFGWTVLWFAVILFLEVLVLGSLLFGYGIDVASPAQFETSARAIYFFLGGILVLASAASYVLFAWITFELARRQRIREKWVLSGLSPSQPTPNVLADQRPQPGPTAPAEVQAPSRPQPPAQPPEPPAQPPEPAPDGGAIQPPTRPMPHYGIPHYPVPGSDPPDRGEEPPGSGWR